MEQTEHSENVELLSGRRKQLIRQTLVSRFGAFLKPGERLEVDAEKSDEYVYATLAVEAADRTFRVEVEGSVLAADQGDEELIAQEQMLELVIEFLKMQLYEFFRSDREERFHVDWRKYPTDRATIRFRGQVTRPALEEQADELLDESELTEDDSD
jgi:hypothetical protein